MAVLLSVIVFLAQITHAAGTTSAAFLRLGAGARASAMGDAFTSRADDASATYWNPAGMSRLARREFLAEHTLHIQDIAVNRLAYVHPLPIADLQLPIERRSGLSKSQIANRKSQMSRAIGVSAAYLALDGIEARTANTSQADYTFGASDFYGAVSYSHPLGPSTSLGLTGKVLQQKLDKHRADTYAADVGVMHGWGRFQLGATLANVGPSVKFINEAYPLPQSLRGGATFNARPVPLTFSLEAERLKGESGMSYRLGAEYDLGGMLAFRMGYLTRPSSTQKALRGSALGTVSNSDFGAATGMAGGVGIRLFGYGLDYAFTPYGELGSAHKISLSARF